MIGLRELRAGIKVFARHLRNARGKPRRLTWVLTRTMSVLSSGKISGILQRHAVMEDLYSDYPEWVRRYDTLSEAGREELRSLVRALDRQPLISILLPSYNGRLQDLAAAVESVKRQLYPRWELCIADDASTLPEVRTLLQQLAASDDRIRLVVRNHNGGISACSNSALELASGEFVAFLDQDDLLAELALFRMVEAIDANPDAAIFYSDEDKLDRQGRRHAPHFKPDWNPEWAKTTNYVLHLCVMSTAAVRAVGGFNDRLDGAQDWDLLLRVVERTGNEAVVHVPRVLYHWREGANSTASGVYLKADVTAAQHRALTAMLARRSINAKVEMSLGGWWIRYSIPHRKPLVSIVIPTRDRGALLRRCVDSIISKTTYKNFELVLVDHASTESAAREVIDWLARNGRAVVVPFAGDFNYAAECNLGVSRARGSIIALLNNDTAIISPWWLDELVGHVLQPGVGLVGSLLLYPDNTIQHAGVVLGANGSAGRSYVGYRRGYSGIAGRAQAAQNVSALVTACAVVRRDRYDEVGGMDESLAISHNDVDLCLRLIERGYRNVWTPHAELYHHESSSRGYDNSPAQQMKARDEEARFRAKWQQLLTSDGCYNVNLTLDGQLFALAFPPRAPVLKKQRVVSNVGEARKEGGRRTRGLGIRGAIDGRGMTVVSVVTVVFNAAATLERAMKSVLAQKYPALEYIVIDGGSTDGTLDIVRRYEHDLDYWISKPDEGIGSAFNNGILSATGQVIGILNGDDWYEPDAVGIAVGVFDACPTAGVVCGNARFHDSSGQIYVVAGNSKYLHREMTISHASTFVRRSVYSKFGMFEKSYKLAMDYELMLRFKIGGVEFVDVDSVLSNIQRRGASDRHWRKAISEVRQARDNHGLPFAKLYGWFMLARSLVSRTLSRAGLSFVVAWFRRRLSIVRKY